MNTRKVAPWIFPGAELLTRCGFKARIYAVDAGEDYPIHGALLDGQRWVSRIWTAEGRTYFSGVSCPLDLMKPARRRVAYVFLDEQGNLLLSSAPTKTHGRLIAGSVRVEVVEGEFAAVDGEEPL